MWLVAKSVEEHDQASSGLRVEGFGVWVYVAEDTGASLPERSLTCGFAGYKWSLDIDVHLRQSMLNNTVS